MAVSKWQGYSVNITGLDQVLANLNKEVRKIQDRTKAGLWEALLKVKYDVLPLTPIKHGHLRGSCYTIPGPAGKQVAEHPEPIKTSSGIAGEIGFTATYAPFVHEIDKHYTVGAWKFLERALKMNYDKILDIIRRRAHVDTGRD